MISAAPFTFPSITKQKMPPVRIELTTPGLQDQCSNPWAMEAYELIVDYILHYTQKTTKLEFVKHRWFSGRMLACHAGERVRFPDDAIFIEFYGIIFTIIKYTQATRLKRDKHFIFILLYEKCLVVKTSRWQVSKIKLAYSVTLTGNRTRINHPEVLSIVFNYRNV